MIHYQLPELPFSKEGLPGFMSAQTVSYHYGKHHKTYVENTNKLLAEKGNWRSLEDIIRNESPGALFNNAAQAWNHSLFWECLTSHPHLASDVLDSDLYQKIEEEFHGIEGLRESFILQARDFFGSGWIWICLNRGGNLQIETTGNGNNPLQSGHTPLLVCDLWEHAYYLDFQNEREKFVKNFWNYIDWKKFQMRYQSEEVVMTPMMLAA